MIWAARRHKSKYTLISGFAAPSGYPLQLAYEGREEAGLNVSAPLIGQFRSYPYRNYVKITSNKCNFIVKIAFFE
jgi:hypothetical protein